MSPGRQRSMLLLSSLVPGVFGALALLVVLLRNSPYLGGALWAVSLTCVVYGLGNGLLVIRFKWRLDELLPEVSRRRQIGSLLWLGPIRYARLLGAAHDPEVLAQPELSRSAAAISALQLGQFVLFCALALTIIGGIILTSLQAGSLVPVLFVAVVGLIWGFGVLLPAHRASQGR